MPVFFSIFFGFPRFWLSLGDGSKKADALHTKTKTASISCYKEIDKKSKKEKRVCVCRGGPKLGVREQKNPAFFAPATWTSRRSLRLAQTAHALFAVAAQQMLCAQKPHRLVST
jgi:hypothetical protein